LTTLRRAGNPYTLNPKRLVHSLLLSGAGLTGRLDQLEAQKLIVRLQDPNDGRALKIRLTHRGLRLVDRVLPRLIELESTFAARMSSTQVSKLTRLLALLSTSVQQADLGVLSVPSINGHLRGKSTHHSESGLKKLSSTGPAKVIRWRTI